MFITGEKEKGRIILILLIAAVLAIGLSLLDKLGVRRALAGVAAPLQTETDVSMIPLRVADYKLVITCKYAYDMEGLVAHTKDYFGWDIGDQLSPRDLTVIWGRVAAHNRDVDFHWTQGARRTALWLDGNVNKEEYFGGEAGLNMGFSNNHIIPANEDVRWKLKLVRRGDHIRLKGYLADVAGSGNNGGVFAWHSSTSRTDVGDGACEVIYTTDIEWL